MSHTGGKSCRKRVHVCWAPFSTVEGMAQRGALRSWFTEHPGSVDETYGEHFRVALGYSGRLAAASGAALVHALCPSLCTTTASERVKSMCDEMMSRATCPDEETATFGVVGEPASTDRLNDYVVVR